jgi:hypothetical protein
MSSEIKDAIDVDVDTGSEDQKMDDDSENKDHETKANKKSDGSISNG